MRSCVPKSRSSSSLTTDRPAEDRWPTVSNSTRTSTPTSPCQDSAMSSAPGCSASSGKSRIATLTPSVARTTPTGHPERSPPARSVPSSRDTSATGGSTRSICGRSARDRPARAAAASTTNGARPATYAIGPCERSATRSWASCTAACGPTRLQRTRRPGPPPLTAHGPGLDNYHLGCLTGSWARRRHGSPSTGVSPEAAMRVRCRRAMPRTHQFSGWAAGLRGGPEHGRRR